MVTGCSEAVADPTVFEIDLPNTGGLQISGLMYGELAADCPVVVMMHGRGDSPADPLQREGAEYLSRRLGVAVLCLAMYGDAADTPNTRRLLDCTLATHVADFGVVVEHLRTVVKASKIFGVGHSYGGATILGSDKALDGAVLWDPSHGQLWQDRCAYTEADTEGHWEGDLWMWNDEDGLPLSRAMVETDMTLGDTSALAATQAYPLLIVSATGSNAVLKRYNRRYWQAAVVAGRDTTLVGLRGASHNFDDSKAIQANLYERTAAWLERQLHG